MLNRDQILAINDIQTAVVHVPEWGGDVNVRGLTALERDRLMAEFFDLEGGGRMKPDKAAEYRVKLAVLCVIDENGERMFADNDTELLGKKNPKAIERIADTVARLSGISEEEIEALEKN